MGTAKKRARKTKAEPASRGLTPAEVAGGKPSASLLHAQALVEERGGEVLAVFRDPLGGNGQLLAALPLESVAPTPFQRDLSEPHVERLRGVLAALDALSREFASVRTGRASASLLDAIRVDYYGTMTPIPQMASVAVPDAYKAAADRSLRFRLSPCPPAISRTRFPTSRGMSLKGRSCSTARWTGAVSIRPWRFCLRSRA